MCSEKSENAQLYLKLIDYKRSIGITQWTVFSIFATVSQAVLVRRTDTGEPEAHTLDLRAIRAGRIPDVRLCPYDVVYLPRTPIAEVGVFMRQYVHSILPVQFSFVYNVNPEVKVK